jgi:hypothetical protein
MHLFWEVCPHLNERERTQFKYIRTLTDSLKQHDSAVHELLSNKNNRIFWKEIPQLEQLFYHIDLWMRKYEALKDEKCVPIIYVGVRERRPFPKGIDELICKKANELEK